VFCEALLAAIGEQLSDCVAKNDEIIGISVGRREKEDIVQIWNFNSKYEHESSVIQKIKHLVPHIKFSVIFYRAHEVPPTPKQSLLPLQPQLPPLSLQNLPIYQSQSHKTNNNNNNSNNLMSNKNNKFYGQPSYSNTNSHHNHNNHNNNSRNHMKYK
jgi:hypothetical protein